MSFENLQLPPYLLARLYKQSLVSLNKLQESGTMSASPKAPVSVAEPTTRVEEAGTASPKAPVSVAEPTARVEEAGTASPKAPRKILGENLAHITLLVNRPDTLHLEDELQQFLASVLGACKLTWKDVALYNVGSQGPLPYKELASWLEPRLVVMFGLSPADVQLPLDFPLHQLQGYGGTTYLRVPELAQLPANPELKRPFWTALKTFFGV